MATLIPSFYSCTSRMTSGERRTAERLEDKLDGDYLVWYDVPVGPKLAHPDFVVLHPRRGLLVLEVKDWKLSTLHQVDKTTWEILVHGEVKKVPNPIEQARQLAHQVNDALERDAQLVQHDGRHVGKLAFPWSYGVVLTNITRAQFMQAELHHAIEPHRVMCADEMQEGVDAEAFQSRLWEMFPFGMRGALSQPQIERVRWILFPEVRVNLQNDLFDDEAPLPDLMRVMDLQQEQLARSLGDGHRVIHGVAGSGKTMILGYRAEYLARAGTAAKPVLVLCFNEPLAVKLASVMRLKQIDDHVHVRHFHKWCRDQLVTYGQTLPDQALAKDAFFEDMVDRVIRAVDRQQIPAGQYRAVLIDEGHDFEPEWLKLVVQMVDPGSNSLLVLYDDAQSIYEGRRGKKVAKKALKKAEPVDEKAIDKKKPKFSFKSVGIQAQGRTTILKINYRNTRQILELSNLVARDLLSPQDTDEDGVPLLRPVSCGREGETPLLIQLPTLRAEAEKITELLSAAHQQGHAWSDMAVIYRNRPVGEACSEAMARRRLPFQWRRRTGDFDPAADSIKLLTMHVSKGLEFPVVAVAGVGQMPGEGESELEEARLFYVAATRATQRLIITASGDSAFSRKLFPTSAAV